MASLVDRVRVGDVAAEPFPYLIVRDALDDALCSRLISEFPPLEVVSGGAPLGSNRRFSMTAHEALEHPQMPDVWRELIRQHVSQQFLDGLKRLFGAHIKRLYPDFEDDFGAVDALRAGVRGVDSFEVSDVQLDAQISINTPVLETPDSVRESHLDAPDKLFVGLFYLRSDDDDSTGGDLEIAQWRSQPRGQRGPMSYRKFVEIVETVPYARNTLILFVNSPNSLHGVTVRSRTKAPRLFMNIVGDVKAPLFDMGAYQASAWDRVLASPDIIQGKLLARRY